MIESLTMLSTAVLIFLVMHRWRCRHWRTSGTRQRNLIRMIIFANPPMIVIAFLTGLISGFGEVEMGTSIVYILVGFNAFLYSYFHVFNMSETARRIRILREVSEGQLVSPSEGQARYSPRDMIMQRLHRLEDLGQIRRDFSGNYHLSGRSLVSAAVIFQKTRSLVMGRKLRSSKQNGKFDR